MAGAGRAAAQLLQGLNRDSDASAPRWIFGWSISGPSCTAAEQASLVLCWVHPLDGGRVGAASPTFGLPAPGQGSRNALGPGPAAPPASSTAPPSAIADGMGSVLDGGHTGVKSLGATAAATLADPRCVAALRSLYASLLAGFTGGCPSCPCPSKVGARENASGVQRGIGGPAHPGPGRLVTVIGSPFGSLAPFHFLNSAVNGTIACAFPTPSEASRRADALATWRQRAEPWPAAGAASSLPAGLAATPPYMGAGDEGGRPEGSGWLGTTLFALDAHLFPGMEGALVTSWPPPPPVPQPPPLSQAPSQHLLTHAALQAHGGAAAGHGGWGRAGRGGSAPSDGGGGSSVAATAGSSTGCGSSLGAAGCRCGADEGCCGGGGGGARPRAPGGGGGRPLAVLCLPLSRRADGVQVPLAVAWPAVEEALAAVLGQLLHPGPHGGGSTVPSAAAAAVASEPRPPQLQLQPAVSLTDQGRCGCFAAAGGALREQSCAALVPAPPLVPNGGDGRQLPRRPAGGPALRYCSVAQAVGPDAGGPRVSTHCGEDRACAAAAAAAAAAAVAGPSCGYGPASGDRAVELPGWVLQAVVLLRCNGSWATGVVVENSTGLLITTAHLFGQAGSGGNGGGGDGGGATGGAGAAVGGGEVGREWAHVVCWARVAWARGEPRGGAGSADCQRGGVAYRWLRARVLYVWSNHLDLAVLQLDPPYGSRMGAAASSAPPPLAPAAVCQWARARDGEEPSPFYASVGRGRQAGGAAAVNGRGDGACGASGAGSVSAMAAATQDDAAAAKCGATSVRTGGQRDFDCFGGRIELEGAGAGQAGSPGVYGSGTRVWAVGHSLVGPSAEWPPLVSAGCVARVLRRRCGAPTMVIATTTTHAGGSGGALLDSAGRLVGLVTSNARHAGGATLPNMAFCIAAEELEPVLRWAAARGGCRQGASSGDSDSSAAEAWSSPATHTLECLHTPPPTVAQLAACDMYDDDAARIWRLQMPAVGSAYLGQAAARGHGQPAEAKGTSGSLPRRGPASRL